MAGGVFFTGFKPRAEIFVANVGSKPVLLRLAACTEDSKDTIRKLEEDKLAAIAHLKAFDFALIPHTNQKNALHIVGLKVHEFVCFNVVCFRSHFLLRPGG